MSKYFLVVVRGEIARRQYNASLESKRKAANKENDKQLVAVVQIQSGKVICIGISAIMKSNRFTRLFNCSYSWMVGSKGS